MEKITKEMTIGEAIQKNPQVAQILFEEGIYCVGCGAAAMETLEEGLAMHGKSEKEIEEIIKKINENGPAGN